jgi:hypothetical protein
MKVPSASCTAFSRHLQGGKGKAEAELTAELLLGQPCECFSRHKVGRNQWHQVVMEVFSTTSCRLSCSWVWHHPHNMTLIAAPCYCPLQEQPTRTHSRCSTQLSLLVPPTHPPLPSTQHTHTHTHNRTLTWHWHPPLTSSGQRAQPMYSPCPSCTACWDPSPPRPHSSSSPGTRIRPQQAAASAHNRYTAQALAQQPAGWPTASQSTCIDASGQWWAQPGNG